MALKLKIQEELTAAVKGRKELESLVLRQVSASILNKEKEKRYKLSREKPELAEAELEEKSRLSDEEVIEVLSFEAKKRREAISEFSKGKREDLVEKEKAELKILEAYLPEQLSEEEVRKIAKEVIEKIGAKEQKDMGKVMAELMPKLKGKADGSLAGKVVKELLA